ncbi:LexA family transcriptional regulator [Methylobacterium nodulans]|uniref:Putative phage repressor n=1 Tax=Methylobacterium nodulans (strain LMG 21967 / CNCM I-2342 / ORS 2060) TaxID=460265 RepID=B8INW9_METNO|nr:S24 family peptidase [Methylobacterium nodulans]ACL58485.1 putative phage repressor [Methylobacterium nodulans ORS 2060]
MVGSMKGKYPNGLAAALQASGVSASELARRLGTSRQNVHRWADGSRELLPPVAQLIASKLGVSASALLLMEEAGPSYIRVAGLVGAGGHINNDVTQVHQNEAVRVRINIPLPDGLSAYEVWGDSMLPRYDPGDLIIVTDQPVPVSRVVGDVALVKTADGNRYLKRVLRGSEPDLYTLESYNASPMEDVEIAEATMIYLILPRRQVTIVHDDAPAPKQAPQ